MDRARDGATGSGMRLRWGLMALGTFVALVALVGQPALAKRMHGTGGRDTIVGTKKADRINARGGNDRVKGRAGGDRLKGGKGKDRLVGGKSKDRLWGGKGRDRLKGSKGKDRIRAGKGRDRIKAGKGADRLKAVDNRRDRAVNGGPGQDVCTIDQADLSVLRNCEEAKVKNGGGGGGPGGDDLRVTSASGLTCGSALPTCPFEISGDGAEALVGSVSGTGGVDTVVGGGVAIVEDDWTAAGLYGCSADGHLEVTIGTESVSVPITCTG